MGLLKAVAAVLGSAVAILGIIGGLLTLPKSFKQFRRDLQPHGNKGVGFVVLSRADSPDDIVIRLLIVEDLIHFLSSGIVKPGRVQEIKSIGEYYEVTMIYPPGANLTFAIVPKK